MTAKPNLIEYPPSTIYLELNMKNFLSWYHPLSSRSQTFENFWRQIIFISLLLGLSFFMASLNTPIVTPIGAIVCLYASWLICWASRQQMKTQNFGKISEIIMWILLFLQVIVATRSNYGGRDYFVTLNITIPIASIFALILLINGFLQKQGINLSLKKQASKIKDSLPLAKEQIQKAASSISKEQ